MAKKTSSKKGTTSVQKGFDRALLQEFTLTGVVFPEVSDILVSDIKKLPPNRASGAAKLTLELNDRYVQLAQKYFAAHQKKDLASKKALRQEEYITECLFINNLMRLGCSSSIEKMQKEGAKHTKADKNGKKFDMFSVIRHNYIYYPDDIALMKSKGYDFNALHTINGKKKDFTAYNLEFLTSAGANLESYTAEMYAAVKEVQTERNAMIEKYEKLEAEKKKASAARKKAIDKEIKVLNEQFSILNEKIDMARIKGDACIEEFIAARQRLLKAVELGVLSPANVAKVKQANIDEIATSFQQKYVKFTRMKNAIYKKDETSSTKSKKQDEVAQTGVGRTLSNTQKYTPDEGLTSLPLGKPVDFRDDVMLAYDRVDNLAKA